MSFALIKSFIVPHRSDNKAKYTPITALNDVEASQSTRTSLSDSIEEKAVQDSEVKTWHTSINPRLVSDAIIGFSDGLVVPFALTAGLSALDDTNIVLYGGIAELMAGCISMGIGGYLGAKGENEAYCATLTKTRELVAHDRDKAASIALSTFAEYDFPVEVLDIIRSRLETSPEELTSFLMRFHHRLAEADYASSRTYICGSTIAAGYFLGGLVPLWPYLVFSTINQALIASVIVMSITLFAFGWTKTALLSENDRTSCFKNAVQMLMLGGIAAAAAMGCVKAVGT